MCVWLAWPFGCGHDCYVVMTPDLLETTWCVCQLTRVFTYSYMYKRRNLSTNIHFTGKNTTHLPLEVIYVLLKLQRNLETYVRITNDCGELRKDEEASRHVILKGDLCREPEVMGECEAQVMAMR